MRAEGGARWGHQEAVFTTAMTDRKPVWEFFCRRVARLWVAAAVTALGVAPTSIAADAHAPSAIEAIHVSAVSAGEYEVAPPPRTSDHILLISTRDIGLRCDDEAMRHLRYEEYVPPFEGVGGWRPLTAAEAAGELAQPMPTVMYVHGNRVANGADKTTGLAMYRTLGRPGPAAPIRYIIWSWPSTKIPGPLRDYQIKAARTQPAGWQLAWTVDKLPPETPLALVGYSYGARVVTGALHLLAGGSLHELRLANRVHPQRAPIRTALLAAAEDAAWLRPGGYHGRALQQIEHLLLVNNQRDPAMRFYRLSPVGQTRALGYTGLDRAELGPLASRVQSVDVTHVVGRHHTLMEYLGATGTVGRALQQVAQLPPRVLAPHSREAIAGRSPDAGVSPFVTSRSAEKSAVSPRQTSG
jgi:hypothetical protein